MLWKINSTLKLTVMRFKEKYPHKSCEASAVLPRCTPMCMAAKPTAHGFSWSHADEHTDIFIHSFFEQMS